MVTLIFQWITILLIIFTLFQYAAVSKSLANSPAHPVSKVFDAAFHQSSIRKDYGEYGRNLSQNYKKYKESLPVVPPGIAQTSSFPGAMPDVKTGFASNPSHKTLDDPSGVHGNNYSVFDINSPSGPFSKP